MLTDHSDEALRINEQMNNTIRKSSPFNFETIAQLTQGVIEQSLTD